MMSGYRTILALGSLAALVGANAPASAEIRCDGSNQIIRGHDSLPTPYCEDGNLAVVAREYGAKVSAHEIRNNPNKKEKICQFVGDDIRVRDTCAPYLSRGGSRR
jgi:hypothetical protein